MASSKQTAMEPGRDAGSRDPEQARQRINETRDRMSATLDRLGEQLEQKRHELKSKADFVRPVRERVRASPLPMIGAAFAAGVVVGLLRGGRSGDKDEPDRVVEYVEASQPVYGPVEPRQHGFWLELRSVLMHQIGNAIVATLAGVISARVSQHHRGEERPPYFEIPR